MSGSSSTTRIWFTVSGPPGRFGGSREGAQDVRLGEDGDQVRAVKHGQGPDLVLEHEPRGRPRFLVGAGDDHPLGHDLAHGEAGESMGYCPILESGGLRWEG